MVRWLKVYRSFVHLQVTPLVERCRVPLAFKGVFRVAKRQFSVSKVQALRRARWGGSLALELLRLSIPVRPKWLFTGWNVVEMLPVRPNPLFAGWNCLRQIRFGSQCATESVYWYLPAKVKQKKSHFGKPPLAEYALRRPPCQSELEEAYESTNKTKVFRRTGSLAGTIQYCSIPCPRRCCIRILVFVCLLRWHHLRNQWQFERRGASISHCRFLFA